MAPEWDQGRWKNGRYFYQLEKEGGKGEPWGRKGLAGEDPGSWISRAPMMNLELNSQFGEVEGGRDIYPVYDHPDCVDGAPIWEVEDEGDVTVHAAPMSHGVSNINKQTKPIFLNIYIYIYEKRDGYSQFFMILIFHNSTTIIYIIVCVCVCVGTMFGICRERK